MGCGVVPFRCFSARVSLPVVLVALARVAASEEAVRDEGSEKDCRCWAAQGACSSNENFMLKTCAASCAWATKCEDAERSKLAAERQIAELREDLERQSKMVKASDAVVADMTMQHKKKEHELQASLAIAEEKMAQIEKKGQESRQAAQVLQKRVAQLEGQLQKKEEQAEQDAALQAERRQADVSQVAEPPPTIEKKAEEELVADAEENLVGREPNAVAQCQAGSCKPGENHDAILSMMLRLNETHLQHVSENSLAHATLNDRIDMQASALSDRLRKLESALEGLEMNRRLAPEQQPPPRQPVESGRPVESSRPDEAAVHDVRGETGSGLERSSPGINAKPAEDSKDKKSLADAISSFWETVQPAIEKASSTGAAALQSVRDLFGSFRMRMEQAAPHVGTSLTNLASRSRAFGNETLVALQPLLSSTSEKSLALARSTFSQLSDRLSASNATGGFDSIRQVASSSSSPLVGIGLAAGAILLLILRRKVIWLVWLPLRAFAILFKLVFLLPFRLLQRCCSCCRRSAPGNSDDGDLKPVRAKMGVSNAMYYDSNLGKWREKGMEHLEEEVAAPPPPPTAASMTGVPSKPAEPAQPQSAADLLMAPPNLYGARKPAASPQPPSGPTGAQPMHFDLSPRFAVPPVQTSAFGAAPRPQASARAPAPIKAQTSAFGSQSVPASAFAKPASTDNDLANLF